MIRQVLRFGMVGAVGYLVDSGLLLALVTHGGLLPLRARLLSFLAAASVTFFLNQHFTFRLGGKFSATRWLFYLATTAMGAAINIGVYQAWLLHTDSSTRNLMLGTAMGSLIAMVVNYTVSSVWVFRPAISARMSGAIVNRE